jgi:hypothetical protein
MIERELAQPLADERRRELVVEQARIDVAVDERVSRKICPRSYGSQSAIALLSHGRSPTAESALDVSRDARLTRTRAGGILEGSATNRGPFVVRARRCCGTDVWA